MSYRITSRIENDVENGIDEAIRCLNKRKRTAPSEILILTVNNASKRRNGRLINILELDMSSLLFCFLAIESS